MSLKMRMGMRGMDRRKPVEQFLFKLSPVCFHCTIQPELICDGVERWLLFACDIQKAFRPYNLT